MRFSEGIHDLREGFALVLQPGLRGYVAVPLVLNLLLFGLLAWWSSGVFANWVEAAIDWLPEWLAFVRPVFWLGFALLFLFVMAYSFVFVATLIGAPFYGLLAEQVQRRLTGHVVEETVSWRALLLLVPRSLWREIRKVLSYLPALLGVGLLLLVGLFIPLVNLVALVLSAVLSSWIMAFEFLDYAADNNRQSIPELRALMRRHRGETFGFGAVAWGLTFVPLVNLVLVPAAVAAGVRQWLRLNGRLAPS